MLLVFCSVKSGKGLKCLLYKATLAAKARPTILKVGHPGTTMKVSVSLTRPVKTHELESCVQ